MYKNSIIIAVDNHFELIDNFFEHLFHNVDISGSEIVIITDGCKNIDVVNYVNQLDSTHNNVKLITLKEKAGYSIANNKAVESSTGEFLIFINTDVFPNYNSIQLLTDYVQSSKKPVIAQGLLLYPQSLRIQSTGHIFGDFFNKHALKNRLLSSIDLPDEIERQALTSAFYAMRKQTFISLGLFDEFYYNCWDGMEFTLRANENNVRNICLTKAIGYHCTGGARNYVYNDETQQSAYFWNKWGSKINNDLRHEIMKSKGKFNKKYYTLINCSFIQQIETYFEALNIDMNSSISLKGKNNNINLYYELPYSMIKSPEAIIFFTDNFMDIASNKHWISLRNNQDDLVVDTSGNIVFLQSII